MVWSGPGAASSLLGVVIVVVVERVVDGPVAHLHPEHRQHLEQAETAADQQVDGNVRLDRAVFQVLHACANMKRTNEHVLRAAKQMMC